MELLLLAIVRFGRVRRPPLTALTTVEQEQLEVKPFLRLIKTDKALCISDNARTQQQPAGREVRTAGGVVN
jgi:hypothetical protein